jgi:stage IV sporulation protein FA
MEDITKISHNFKKSNKKRNNISRLFSKILLCIILILSCLIYTNCSDKNRTLFKDNVINKNIRLTKYRKKYEKLFGNFLPKKEEQIKQVFKEEQNNKKIENYLDGTKITYEGKSNVAAIQSGIVVYIGNKEDLGNTVIIQGVDDVDIWYSNINKVGLKLYDYIEKDKIIGEVENTLYLNIIKDKKHLKYEEYTKTI